MEMYKAIKEIEKDLISRSYIKEPKDINLHLSSRFDQYGLKFDSELQEADIKRRIIRTSIDNRKAIEMSKKIRANNAKKDINNTNKAINNIETKKAKRKYKAKRGKDIFVINLKNNSSRFYNSYREVSRKFGINYGNLTGRYLKEEKYYFKRKGIVLIRCQEGDNKVLLQNIDEVIRIAKEIYHKENESKFVDKMNPLEAIDLAVKIVEERLKNENR